MKEVTDYKQLSNSEIEDLLTDYQNELATIEARQEWLTNETKELQAILDERDRDDEEGE